MTPEHTRRDIVAAARAAFAEHGYAATSIRDLAKRLDISSAALYYHFPHKLAVLEAVATPYLDAIEAILVRFPSSATSDRAAKRQFLAAYLDVVLASPDVADLVGRERALENHPKLGPRMALLVSGVVDRLCAPQLSPGTRLRATAAIGALRRPVLRPEIDADQQREELLDAAMAALGD